MTGNLWARVALLVVLLMTATAVVLPAAAQSTATTEPMTWTLAPTPGETLTEETAEETPDDEAADVTPDETPEETPAGVMENETPEETLVGTVENETSGEAPAGTTSNTTNQTVPPVLVETDEVTPETTPGDASTVELPTFTPIQAAQVNGSETQAAPLSPAGAVLAALVAALVVVFGRNRR